MSDSSMGSKTESAGGGGWMKVRSRVEIVWDSFF